MKADHQEARRHRRVGQIEYRHAAAIQGRVMQLDNCSSATPEDIRVLQQEGDLGPLDI